MPTQYRTRIARSILDRKLRLRRLGFCRIIKRNHPERQHAFFQHLISTHTQYIHTAVHPSIKAPTPQYISAGAAGLVMCTINLGNPPVPPENVKWYRNQSQLLSGGRYSYNFSHGLTIESIQPEDSGVYTCLIYTGVGTEREDINVMVQVPNPDKREAKQLYSMCFTGDYFISYILCIV